jgi:uncharacterized protein YhhL (DUF1145 family)
MVGNLLALVGLAIFLSTVFIILVHAIEWLQIGRLPRSASTDDLPSNQPPSRVLVLKTGLGIETFYYFLLLIALVIYFPSNLIFLTLIAILALVHLATFQAVMGKRAETWLVNMTNRRAAGLLIFDILELFVLIVLASVSYSWIQAGI